MPNRRSYFRIRPSRVPFAFVLLGAWACGAEPKPDAVPAAVPVTAPASLESSAAALVPSAPETAAAPVVGGPPGGGPTVGGATPGPEVAAGAPEKLEVAAGATFEVRLEANATTGYQWKVLEPLDPHLAFVSDVYEPTPTPPGPGGAVMVGSGGTARFTFKGVTAGQATLRLGYARPWEKGPPGQVRTWEVTVR
jgi:inhibitor of cysteine peptidase